MPSARDEPVPGRLRDASPVWLQVEMGWDAVNDFWNQRVVRFDAQSQFDLLERLGVDDPDWRALGLGLAGSLAAFFVALTAYLAWRYRAPPRDWPARLHDVVVARLRKRGLSRARPKVPSRSSSAPKRPARTCARPGRDPEALRRAAYGPRPATDDLQRLKHAVNSLRA